MIRVSQEAANRLEAETLRRSIKSGLVLARSNVLDQFIIEHFPPADAPLIEPDTENEGVNIEVNQTTDDNGKEKP